MMESNNLKCSLCGSFKGSPVIATHVDQGVEYVLRECPDCLAQYWTPFKNPGREWYENDERYKGANANPPINPTRIQEHTLKFLAPLKGKVFDIGCGTGNFLYLAQKNGWQVAGIDFDANAVDSATNKFGLPNIELLTLNEYVAKYPEVEGGYDLVTFFDVFEHIDNHIDFIRLVKTLLKPRGYISMSMPYRNGSRWLQPYDLPPRHLTRWDRRSLAGFLEKQGFKIALLKRVPATFFEIVMKLRFKYGKFASFGLVGKVQDIAMNDSNKTNKLKLGSSRKKMIIHFLAKTKDVILFGVPALFLWIYFRLTGGLYTGLSVIASYK